jgi:hypothetical protein
VDSVVSPGDVGRILADHYKLDKERRAAQEVGWASGTAVNSDLLTRAMATLSLKQTALVMAG